MKHYEQITTCAFCDRNLARSTGNQAASQRILCENCRVRLSRELNDPNWEQSDWWLDYKASYWREEHQRVRQHAWSIETIAEQEQRGYTTHVPTATINGKANTLLEGSVRKIITRLYQSYGYGNKRITHILTTTYRIEISSRAVRYHLAEIKKTGITPNADAKHWRDWHRELRRLERENSGVQTHMEDDDDEED